MKPPLEDVGTGTEGVFGGSFFKGAVLVRGPKREPSFDNSPQNRYVGLDRDSQPDETDLSKLCNLCRCSKGRDSAHLNRTRLNSMHASSLRNHRVQAVGAVRFE